MVRNSSALSKQAVSDWPSVGDRPELADIVVAEFRDRAGVRIPGRAGGSSERAPAAGGPGAALPSQVAGRVHRWSTCPSATAPDKPLIEDFTLEAAPGQTIAIVGQTGAGKTTVVNLLMRFYESPTPAGSPSTASITATCTTRDQVRRCFGMVLQDTWLFARVHLRARPLAGARPAAPRVEDRAAVCGGAQWRSERRAGRRRTRRRANPCRHPCRDDPRGVRPGRP